MNFRMDYDKIQKRNEKKAKAAKKDEVQVPISVAYKRVVITGTIPGMTRVQVTRLLQTKGCVVSGFVTSDTHCLIVGNTRGSDTRKQNAARENGVKIVPFKFIKELTR